MKYLLIALFVSGIAAADWQYSEEIDPITDEATRLIYNQGSSDVSGYLHQPSLFVRITGDVATGISTELWVSWTSSVGESDLPLCITRVDGEEPVEYEVVPSMATPNSSTFFTYANYLFVKLLRGNQFVVRFTPTGLTTMTAIFSLEGMTAAARNAGMPVDFIVSKVDSVVYISENRFTETAGIITDNATNLQWRLGPDSDTSWNEANSWINGLGGSWRMPSLNELRGLYNAGITYSDMGHFQNGGSAVWGNQIEGYPAGWTFNFGDGNEYNTHYSEFGNYGRAFAVRSQ